MLELENVNMQFFIIYKLLYVDHFSVFVTIGRKSVLRYDQQTSKNGQLEITMGKIK